MNEINDQIIDFEDQFSLRQHINMFQLLTCLSEEGTMNQLFKKAVIHSLPIFLKKLEPFITEIVISKPEVEEVAQTEHVPQKRKNNLYVANKIYGDAAKNEEQEIENEKKLDDECIVKDNHGNVKGKFVCKLEMEKESYRKDLFLELQHSIQAAIDKIKRII